MKTFAINYRQLLLMIAVIFQLTTFSCSGQSRENENKKTEKSKPDVRYKVDKEYDPQGNLIRYDSAYSYSYNGSAINDSMFNLFKMDFPDPFNGRFFERPITGLNPDTLFFDRPQNFDPFLNHDQHFRRMLEEMKKMQQYNERSWFYDKPQRRNSEESDRMKGTGV